jgi:AbrB family looped-hinge helix DNA binding protein
VRIVKVSSKGRIVIPEEVRKRHRINRGTELVLLESGGAIVLRKKADVEGILRNEFGPFLRASEDALKALWESPEDDVWNGA